jgi:hypothetical protein
MGRSVDEFYDHVRTTSDAGRKLPNWCVVTFLPAGECCELISVMNQGMASCI